MVRNNNKKNNDKHSSSNKNKNNKNKNMDKNKNITNINIHHDNKITNKYHQYVLFITIVMYSNIRYVE